MHNLFYLKPKLINKLEFIEYNYLTIMNFLQLLNYYALIKIT